VIEDVARVCDSCLRARVCYCRIKCLLGAIIVQYRLPKMFCVFSKSRERFTDALYVAELF